MNKQKWLIMTGVVAALFALLIAGYWLTKEEPSPLKTGVTNGQDMHAIDDLKVMYQLNAETQKLYSIQVMSGAQASKQNSGAASNKTDIFVSGKACNNMSGTISLLAKGTNTGKQAVKMLDDGRVVLEPQVMSTLMACTSDITTATDDQALSKVFNDIAASLQSF